MRTSESKGHQQIYDSSVVFGFEVPTRGEPLDLRNFKSTTLVPQHFRPLLQAVIGTPTVRYQDARRKTCGIYRRGLEVLPPGNDDPHWMT
jgi:hypothetical protein